MLEIAPAGHTDFPTRILEEAGPPSGGRDPAPPLPPQPGGTFRAKALTAPARSHVAQERADGACGMTRLGLPGGGAGAAEGAEEGSQREAGREEWRGGRRGARGRGRAQRIMGCGGGMALGA